MNKNLRVILFYVVIIIGMLAVTSFMMGGGDKKPITYSDVVEYFEAEKVKDFEIDNSNRLTMTIRADDGGSDTTVVYELRSLDMFYQDLGDLYRDQSEKGIIEHYDFEPPTQIPAWVSFLPYIRRPYSP